MFGCPTSALCWQMGDRSRCYCTEYVTADRWMTLLLLSRSSTVTVCRPGASVYHWLTSAPGYQPSFTELSHTCIWRMATDSLACATLCTVGVANVSFVVGDKICTPAASTSYVTADR